MTYLFINPTSQLALPKNRNFRAKYLRSASKTYSAGHQKGIHVGVCGGFEAVFSLNHPVPQAEKESKKPGKPSKTFKPRHKSAPLAPVSGVLQYSETQQPHHVRKLPHGLARTGQTTTSLAVSPGRVSAWARQHPLVAATAG
jgi:hypothetical protein